MTKHSIYGNLSFTMEEIFELKGKTKGPVSIILAGVHGNEIRGIEALKKTIQTLQIDSGSIFFIYANPKAIQSGKRFIDANLNRMFKKDSALTDSEKKSYEYGRAQFLKKYLDQADVLLDLHTSSTPESKPFAICEKNALEIAKFLPVDRIVSGFDQVEPGGTDYYMNNINKIGICVECGFTEDPGSAIIAEETINAFVKARGHIKNDLKACQQAFIRIDEIYKTKTGSFVLSKNFQDFEEVSEDQTIGIDGELEIRARQDGFILFARNRNATGEEAFLFGKKKQS